MKTNQTLVLCLRSAALALAVTALSCQHQDELSDLTFPALGTMGEVAREDDDVDPGDRGKLSFEDPPPHSAIPRSGPLELSLEATVMLSLQNNRSLRVQQLNPIRVGAFEERERSLFDPRFVGSAIYSEDEVEQVSRATGEQFSVSGEDLSSGLSVSQRLPTGTDLSLDSSFFRTESDRTPLQTRARAGLTVTQALLRGARPAANLANLNQARLDTEISVFELRSFAESFVAQVENAFWDYSLARRELAIFEESIELAEEQRRATRQRIEVGQVAETELAAAEAEVALRRQDLINARNRVESLRLSLLRILNPEPGEDGWDRAIQVPEELDAPEAELDPVASHVELALRHRPEIHETNLRLRQHELEVVQTRNGLLPRLDLIASFSKSGFSDSFGGAVRNLDGDSFEASIGFRGEYAWGNRDRKAADLIARTSRQQARIGLENLAQLVEFDVRNAYLEVQRAQQQIEASAATRRLQEETLRAEQEKFRVGRATALQVALAQRDLLSSQISEIEAVVQFRKALVDLYRLDGSLLFRRGISAPGDPNEQPAVMRTAY